MKLHVGQAFTFKGENAQDLAREVVAEFGDSGAKIEESRYGFAKVRILREGVLAPKAERVPDRGARFSFERVGAGLLALVTALTFWISGGVTAAGTAEVGESAPVVEGAAGAHFSAAAANGTHGTDGTYPPSVRFGATSGPRVWLNGVGAARGSTFNVQRSTFNVQRGLTTALTAGLPLFNETMLPMLVSLAAITTGSKEADMLIAFIGGMTAFVAAMKARDAFIGKKPDAQERVITPSPLIVTPAKEWATVGEVTELKEEMHRQMVEQRAYVHKGLHDLRDAMNMLVTGATAREERMSDKMGEMDVRNQERFEKIMEKVGELRGQIDLDARRKRTP